MLSRFSHIRLFAALWTEAHQASLSMGFSRKEYWSGLPRFAPGDLPDPGIEPTSPVAPALQADSLPLYHSHQGSLCVYIYTHAHTFNCSRGVKGEYYSSRRWCEEVLYLKQVRSMWASFFSSSMSIKLYNMFPSYFIVFLLGSNEIVHIKEIC